MTDTTTIEPIRRSVTVRCAPADAFRIFTEEIATWWPLADYSISEERAVTVVFEPDEGGRLYEIDAHGREHIWGSVLVWDPPSLLRYTWHPGSSPDRSTEVEVRFLAEGADTRVDLEHRHWDRLGEKAAVTRAGYDGGWTEVVAAYVRATG